jgi:hypothetical protein
MAEGDRHMIVAILALLGSATCLAALATWMRRPTSTEAFESQVYTLVCFMRSGKTDPLDVQQVMVTKDKVVGFLAGDGVSCNMRLLLQIVDTSAPIKPETGVLLAKYNVLPHLLKEVELYLEDGTTGGSYRFVGYPFTCEGIMSWLTLYLKCIPLDLCAAR